MDDEAIREITRRHARCILFWTRRRADVARRISFSLWRFRCCSRDGALRLRPTLLVGEAGTGKSRLAHRVFERLGLPYTVAPVGGTADARLLGTAKGWSTGHGSVVAEAFLRHRKASPGLVVDELEKVGTSRHNGSLWDGLLGLLEPETSRRWLDPYVGEIDASAVSWICTANSIEPLPGPLRSRLRVLRVPQPNASHAEPLIASILDDLAAARGLDRRWYRLDGEEMAALREALAQHRSLRILCCQVERVVEMREAPHA